MQPTPVPPRPVENHLAWALGCLVLFWPLAIPAIVNATRVNALLAAGDHGGAEHAAQEARKWAIWATAVGALWWILLICCPLGIVVAGDPTQVAAWVSHLVGHS